MKVDRPFISLSIKPFLFASDDQLSHLQKKYIALSRRHHPDLLSAAPQDERDANEAQLSQINRDHAVLKNVWTRLECVLDVARPDLDSLPTATASKAPPELAASYFELQELWSSADKHSPSVRLETENFISKVQTCLKLAEESVTEMLRPFPYSNEPLVESDQTPWSLHDLQKIRLAYQGVKYYKSFLKDLLRQAPL